MIKRLLEFYGNRGYRFDLFLSVIVVAILLYLQFSFDFIREIIVNLNESTISFFAILVGFLLTIFSLLFLYNPQHSKDLMKLRRHKEYKNMLYAFISTAFILIILTISLLFSKVLVVSSNLIYSLVFGLIVFSFLRVFKCVFYLFVILELS